MKVLSTDGLTKLIQLVKSAFISVDDTETTTEIDTVTTSEVTLATVATSGSYNDLTNKPDLTTKADVDLSNLNASGKTLASGLGMPSGTYNDLTLGASGASYTAPANGWIVLTKQATGGQYMQFQNETSNWIYNLNATSGWYLSMICPVARGDSFKILYNLGGDTAQFRFIYAEGEE